MKIEKLTENKIRIIIKQEELNDPTLDLQSIMTKASTSQSFFLDMLNRAKKEVGFDTEGHKLLIEAFSSPDNVMVFTITKFEKLKEDNVEDLLPLPFLSQKRGLKVKRKINMLPKASFSVYRFNSFDEYCDFCNYLKLNPSVSTYRLANEISLYKYEDQFYLILSGINMEHKSLAKFYTLISEFASFCTHDNNFENVLKEHGKCVIKKNAIGVGMKYFIG